MRIQKGILKRLRDIWREEMWIMRSWKRRLPRKRGIMLCEVENCGDTWEMGKEFQLCTNTRRFWMLLKVFMRIWDIMEQLSPPSRSRSDTTSLTLSKKSKM